MLRYVYGYDQLVADFVAGLIPHARRGFSNVRAIGVINEIGQLIAGMVYHNWDPDAGILEMSGASKDPQWLTRQTLARIYHVPFVKAQCQMTVMRVPEDDERLLRQLAVYGYVFVKVPRMFGRERNGVLCLLTYEAWAANKFNKRFDHHLLPFNAFDDTQDMELTMEEAA